MLVVASFFLSTPVVVEARRDSSKRQAQAEKFRARGEKRMARAGELAGQMGIEFDPQNAKLKVVAEVPIIINGHKVPENLFTEKEKEGIATAETIRRMMMGK
ncbi:MAG: hypothetical protein KAS02_02425 [Candidatus Pacebacteria bacterium]|nr:hypothetical protein [Candidatus Paceibacterota bacterium]